MIYLDGKVNSLNKNLDTLWYPEMFVGVCEWKKMERPNVFFIRCFDK